MGKVERFQWLDYNENSKTEEIQSDTQSSKKMSTWKSASRIINQEPSHDLNKTAELFENHLPEPHLQYLLILLSGIETPQLMKLTETLKKISILLNQHKEILSEFHNCITPLMKRKLS